MSLESDYELLELLRDDGVQSFRAREISTGRQLEVHVFLPFGRPENKALFDRLKALPLEKRRQFLDVGSDGSTPYIVTDPLPGAPGFKEWSAGLLAARPAAPFPSQAAPPAPSLDDSVQILQAGQWRTGTPLPESLIAPHKPPQEPPQDPPAPPPHRDDLTVMFRPDSEFFPATPEPPAAREQPGEFTQMFRQAEPEPQAPPTAQSQEPGEFTRMFRAPAFIGAPPTPAPHTLAPPAAPPAAADPLGGLRAPAAHTGSQPEGEFTKFFDGPMQPAPLSRAPEMASSPVHELPPLPRTPAPSRGGEFTEMFGKPASSAAVPYSPLGDAYAPPPPPIGGTSVGTGGFGASDSAGPNATSAFSAPPVAYGTGAGYNPSGPSEYTKMISGSAVPTLGQPVAAPPPPAPAAPAKKSNAPMFVALGAFVLLAILIVIFFALRNR